MLIFIAGLFVMALPRGLRAEDGRVRLIRPLVACDHRPDQVLPMDQAGQNPGYVKTDQDQRQVG